MEVTLSSGDIITIKAGELSESVEVETLRVDDAYIQDTTTETVSITNISNSEIDIVDKIATIIINDDVDPIGITITAAATTPKIIDVNTEFGETTGVNIYATNTLGDTKEIAIVTGTNHDGFGVKGKTTGSGADAELGNLDSTNSEKIVVAFDKDVNSLDIAFAWRHNGETARVTFVNDDQIVGYAEVKGGGNNTEASVNYYRPNGDLIRSVEAQGGTDRVDLSYTFELKDGNELIAFDKVEFTAPGHDDDYLINKIIYREVVNPDLVDITTEGGNVTFDIQIDENYPPQGTATAIVSISGVEYEVILNATGRGTITIDSTDLGDLSNIVATVVRIEGGNYEQVDTKTEEFDFSVTLPIASDDTILVDEDIPYTLKINDFGDELSAITTEFKITELPTNGTLYYKTTIGETVIDKEGNTSVATEDSKVAITEDQIISLIDVNAGRVIFEPIEHSDEDGVFKFMVGNGGGNFSDESTTTIEVKAIADEPVASINVVRVATSESSSEVIIKAGSTIYNIDEIITNKGNFTQYTFGDQNDQNYNMNSINNVTITDTMGTTGNKFVQGNSSENIIIVNGDFGTSEYQAKINANGGNDLIIITGDIVKGDIGDANGDADIVYISKSSEYFVFSGTEHNTNGTGMDGTITQYSGANGTGTIIGTMTVNNIEGIIFADGVTLGTVEKVSSSTGREEYEVDFSAALADIDGSETLTVLISGVPIGATFNSDALVPKGNGIWEVTIGKDNDGKPLTSIQYEDIKMIVPEGTENVNLTITARATDTQENGGETNTNFVETTDSDALVNIKVNDSTPDIDGDNIVYEKGLTCDTDVSEKTSGKFTISAVDGIKMLTVAGHEIDMNALQTSVTNHILINTTYGNITITAYDEIKSEVSYTYQITENTTDHSDIDSNEIVLDKILLKVTDKDGDSQETTLSIRIVDDVVVAKNTTIEVDAISKATFNANVVLTLDYSTSMKTEDLNAQKAAALKLLDQYKATSNSSDGDVKVMVIKFGSTGVTKGWQTIDEAKAYINDGTPFTGTQYTNYDDALKVLINNYDNSGSGKIIVEGTINTSYFMTDGVPTVANRTNDGKNGTTEDKYGDGIGTGYTNNPFYAKGTSASSTKYVGADGEVGQGNWEAFLTKNQIVSYAIGMGSNVSSTALEPIAYNGTTGQQEHDKLLQPKVDFNKLGDLLVSIAPEAQAISNKLDVNFGADGGYISSITIHGITHSFDGLATSEKNLTVTTSYGEFKIDMSTGSYTYVPKNEVLNTSEKEIISFIATDKDGDTAEGTLTIDLEALMRVDGSSTLIDGIIEGAEYRTSSGLKGLTDENGQFNYREGDSVIFNVGGVIVGTVTAQQIADNQIFLQDIANVDRTDLNDEYLENLATFLQSIDSDSGDNIVITQETRDAFVNLYLNLQTASEADVKALIESVGITFVDEETAMVHVQEMLERYAGINVNEFDIHYNDSILHATFGIAATVGITYITSSGLEGFTDINGKFSYNLGDTITFLNEAGESVAVLDSNLIGDDNLITLSELGITLDDLYSKNEDNVLENIETEEIVEDKEVVESEKTTEEVENKESTPENILFDEDEESIDLTFISLKETENFDQEVLIGNNESVDLDEVLVPENEELIISGENKEIIELDTPNDWSSSGKEQVDGSTYNVYKGTGDNSTVKLFIEDDIEITPDI